MATRNSHRRSQSIRIASDIRAEKDGYTGGELHTLKGNDKHARVNAVAPLFESGMIYAPEQKFADDVIEECAAFPYGDHDDLVDSTTQAIMRFRQGGLIGHPEDYIDEKVEQRKRNYY